MKYTPGGGSVACGQNPLVTHVVRECGSGCLGMSVGPSVTAGTADEQPREEQVSWAELARGPVKTSLCPVEPRACPPGASGAESALGLCLPRRTQRQRHRCDTHPPTHPYACAHVYTGPQVYTGTHMYSCTRTHTYTHTHKYTPVHMRVHITHMLHIHIPLHKHAHPPNAVHT